ncbi:hypothetical protein C0Q70_19261 [Pomacea canaliculata]|uniref:Uncharacterized protein n=1 Tax=Pomacea canaliculata TaxID=400727 RepID=A0A2T7NIW4_POMCA|nr:hypothetical protein C0Q70_19261 [Pomacea canaliculata]
MTGPLFKVILVGDAGVGKLLSFAASKMKTTSSVKTPPQRWAWKAAYILCLRLKELSILDEPASLYGLSRWESEVMESAPAAVKFLVGNKADLHKAVLPEAIQAFAHAHNCQAAFLTSAKTREGLDGALASLGVHLMEKYDRHSHRKDEDRLWREGSGMHVHGDENRGSKCC